jgi:hypothetical protein
VTIAQIALSNSNGGIIAEGTCLISSIGRILVGNILIMITRAATTKILDRHFVIGWSLADTEKVNRYTAMLTSLYGKPEHEATYSKLADCMIDLVERRHNDHHNAVAELGHDWLTVEPINTPAMEPDMVTFQGLNKLLKIYIATASGIFKYIGRGTAAATPTPYTTALQTETGTRQDATTTGFHEVKGSSIRMFSSFASTTATATMQQVAVFDATTTGIMLAIHDFGGAGFTHTVNVDSFSIGMVLDFIPFGDV